MTSSLLGPPPASEPEVKKFGNVYNGRYHMPPIDDPNAWLPGGAQRHIPRGVKRTSKQAAEISDLMALHLWEQRKALDGIRKNVVLQEELATMVDPTDDQLNAFFKKAKAYGGGTEAARRGTLRHDMLEHWLTTGEEIGTAFMRLQLAEVQRAFREHLLMPVPELTECLMYNDEIKCTGRWDGAVIDMQTGELHIDDLKSKRRQFWTMLEVEIQLAIYARGTARWDVERGCYVDMPAFSLDEGYVVHMPVDGDPETGEPAVWILRADLQRGWNHALLAAQVSAARSVGKSAATLRASARPHPGITLVEAYARRFMGVASAREGSALVAECLRLNVWCPELEHSARQAVERIMSEDLEITS